MIRSSSLLASERFLGKIKIDSGGNAVFPHFDTDGLTGYELKKRNFKGLASGGTKALWVINTEKSDDCMVFCESAIDALSYAVLFPDNQTCYASIGGKPNPVQPELIRAAAARMRAGSEITAAMDADADGHNSKTGTINFVRFQSHLFSAGTRNASSG
jgi:Toprim-like